MKQMTMALIVAALAMVPSVGFAKTKCHVNVNKATMAQLMLLPSVGPATAKRIVEARPFKAVEELEVKVKGIGPKTLAKIAPFAKLKGATTLTAKVRCKAGKCAPSK